MFSRPLQLSQGVVLSALCTTQRYLRTHRYHPYYSNNNDSKTINNSYNTRNEKSSGENKRMIIENRASKWCLRLWGLSRRRTRQQEVESKLLHSPHLELETSEQQEISKENTRNDITQSSNSKSDHVHYDQMRDNALLHDLHQRIQHTVGSASNALPVLMAEAIWNVYDELVSPYTAHEMKTKNNNKVLSKPSSLPSSESMKDRATISTKHAEQGNITSDQSAQVNQIQVQEEQQQLEVEQRETQVNTMLEEQEEQEEEKEDSYVTNFFRFISLIVQLDMDISALQDATTLLTNEMQHYNSLLTQLNKLQANNISSNDGEMNNCSSGSDCHSECKRDPTHNITSDHSTETVRHALLLSKGNLTRLGFNVRAAAAPLHYLWLRHTAATENGLRRIMDFRKTVHMFDIQCKTRMKELNRALHKIHTKTNITKTSNQTQMPNTTDNKKAVCCIDTQKELEKKLQRQISKWMTRQRHIYLIDNSLGLLFNDFFSKEYLVMEELTWFNSPPMLLEQIMAAEQVHPFVHGLTDMKYRLQPAWHRHLFAFLHPAIVEEPLIAVQVALTNGFARSVDVILHRSTPLADEANQCMAAQEFQLKYGIRERETNQNIYGNDNNPLKGTKDKLLNTYVCDDEDDVVDTAIFYSINSAQSSLRGMDMGNMLIKRAVKEIDEVINTSRRAMQRSLIVHFSTLSPIPSYVRWLSNEVDKFANVIADRASSFVSQKSEEEMNSNERIKLELLQQVFGEMEDHYKFEQSYLTPLREKLIVVTAELLSVQSEDNSNNNTSNNNEMLDKLKMHYNALNMLLENNSVSVNADSNKVKMCEIAKQEHYANKTTVEVHFHTLKMLVYLFRSVQDKDRYKWWWNHSFTQVLEKPLLKSVAHYLLEVKKIKTGMSNTSTPNTKQTNSTKTNKETTHDDQRDGSKTINNSAENTNVKDDSISDKGKNDIDRSNKHNIQARMYDPVGNFHITNGATILQINYLANTTAQGSRESGCVMVNYWYNMNTVADNVRQYELEYTVAATEQMNRTLHICEFAS